MYNVYINTVFITNGIITLLIVMTEKCTHTQTSIYSKLSNIIQKHTSHTYPLNGASIIYTVYRIVHLLIKYYVPHLLIMYGYCTIVIYINSIVVLYLSLASSESSSSNGGENLEAKRLP